MERKVKDKTRISFLCGRVFPHTFVCSLLFFPAYSFLSFPIWASNQTSFLYPHHTQNIIKNLNKSTALFPREKRYHPYLEIGGIQYFNQESKAAGMYDLFFPVFTPASDCSKQLIFTDLRFFDRTGSSFEGNAHVGYRVLLPETKDTRNQLFGVYLSFDRRKSEKKNYFNQITIGGEAWYDKWFIGGNLYTPIGKKRRLSKQELHSETQSISRKKSLSIGRIVDYVETHTTIKTEHIFEKLLYGVDAETGYAFTEKLTGYAGSYWFQDGFFESSKNREVTTKWGPKIRLTYNYHPIKTKRVFGIFDGVSLEAGMQHDKPRGTSGYIGLKLKAGLTNSKKTMSNLFGFERHLTELVKRDPDIILNEMKKWETAQQFQLVREKEREKTKEELLKEFGLLPDATEREIKKQYRTYALHYHPDKNKDPEASEKFVYYTELHNLIKKKRDKEARQVKRVYYQRNRQNEHQHREYSSDPTQALVPSIPHSVLSEQFLPQPLSFVTFKSNLIPNFKINFVTQSSMKSKNNFEKHASFFLFLDSNNTNWSNSRWNSKQVQSEREILFPVEINQNYAYEAHDIHTLLFLRLKETQRSRDKTDQIKRFLTPPLLFNSEQQRFLSSSSPVQFKSFLSKSLVPFIEEEEILALVPVNIDHQHWIGLIAYFTKKRDLNRIDYVDSLREENSQQLSLRLEQMLRKDYGMDFPLYHFKGWIQKDNEAHCGPLLIENLVLATQSVLPFYNVVEQERAERKREKRGGKQASKGRIEAIRQHHLELLELSRPELWFSFRQSQNLRSFEYRENDAILLRGGVSLNSIPFFFAQEEERTIDQTMLNLSLSSFTFALAGKGYISEHSAGPDSLGSVISIREVIGQYAKIVIPFSLTGLVTTANNYIHSIFLSRLDKEALAANGLIMSIQFLVCLGSEIPYTVGILIPRVLGKEKNQDVGRIVRQGVLLSGIIVLPQMAIGFFSGPLLNALGQSAELSELAQQYFIGYSLGLPARLGMGISDQLAIGTAHPNLVLIRTLAHSTLVGLLSYGFMFGEWGGPKLNIAGLGYADSIASWLTLGGMALYFKRSDQFSSYQLFRNDWQGGAIRSSLLGIGYPVALQSLFLTIGYTSLSMMKGWLGSNTLLAQQIVTQTLFFFYCIEGGIAQASATLVSRAIGEGNPLSVRRLGNMGLILGSSVALIGEAVFIMVPSLLAGAFLDPADSENEEALELTNMLFFTEGLILIAESLAQITKGNLRGGLSTKIGITSDLAKMGTLLGVGYLFGFSFNGGIIGISCAELIGTGLSTWILLRSWFR